MPEEKTKKPAVKAEKKTAAAEKKPAAKKAAPAKKTAAKKPAAKKAPAKKAAPVVEISPLDEITTIVWKKLEKKKVDDIPFPIAIQVNVHEVGVFFIAVNADPNEPKRVIQANYYLADGVVDTSADEIKKIIAGNYDYIAAAKSGAFTYRGDLTKGALVAELLK